jgi:hypothetical protein
MTVLQTVLAQWIRVACLAVIWVKGFGLRWYDICYVDDTVALPPPLDRFSRWCIRCMFYFSMIRYLISRKPRVYNMCMRQKEWKCCMFLFRPMYAQLRYELHRLNLNNSKKNVRLFLQRNFDIRFVQAGMWHIIFWRFNVWGHGKLLWMHERQ